MALKPLNSVAGFSVGQTPANIILANGDITTNNFTTTGVANLNNVGNVLIYGGSSGHARLCHSLAEMTGSHPSRIDTPFSVPLKIFSLKER